MTPQQWEKLLAVIDGQALDPLPVGFVIDSPWLPGWAGITALDYYTSEQMWFEANVRAVEQFPDVMFLPGFWSEFGMCTEPSAFGAKCSWHETELPHAAKIITDFQEAGSITKPDPAKDGLLPFVLSGSQVFITRFSSTMPNDPNQKMMMYMMPVIMMFLLYHLPSGLFVYWILSNLWQMAHQAYAKHAIHQPLKEEMQAAK